MLMTTELYERMNELCDAPIASKNNNSVSI
jgi:hypothetical protein